MDRPNFIIAKMDRAPWNKIQAVHFGNSVTISTQSIVGVVKMDRGISQILW